MRNKFLLFYTLSHLSPQTRGISPLGICAQSTKNAALVCNRSHDMEKTKYLCGVHTKQLLHPSLAGDVSTSVTTRTTRAAAIADTSTALVAATCDASSRGTNDVLLRVVLLQIKQIKGAFDGMVLVDGDL